MIAAIYSNKEMNKKKQREPIPPELAARVLFLADRICCVCRVPGKPVQIHHIDEITNNNTLKNLAVLCFDCHRETQIRGGFDRKLDAEQVTLYRDNWNEIVAMNRAAYEVINNSTSLEENKKLEKVTTIAEIYRENEEFGFLASFYHSIGNKELRDKYIELALAKEPSDFDIIHLRSLQNKQELIPADVIEREEARYTENRDWSQRARFYKHLGRYIEAIQDYIQTIQRSLEKGNIFSAAYYLKELVESSLSKELLIIAYKEKVDKGDLWWQVRALQELNWQKELNELLLNNAKEIQESKNLVLNKLLATAQGDTDRYFELEKQDKKGMKSLGDGILRVREEIEE
jgi:tetratricopeptide (TPR) repeat protein